VGGAPGAAPGAAPPRFDLFLAPCGGLSEGADDPDALRARLVDAATAAQQRAAAPPRAAAEDEEEEEQDEEEEDEEDDSFEGSDPEDEGG
jgi:hypothetical protein